MFISCTQITLIFFVGYLALAGSNLYFLYFPDFSIDEPTPNPSTSSSANLSSQVTPLTPTTTQSTDPIWYPSFSTDIRYTLHVYLTQSQQFMIRNSPLLLNQTGLQFNETTALFASAATPATGEAGTGETGKLEWKFNINLSQWMKQQKIIPPHQKGGANLLGTGKEGENPFWNTSLYAHVMIFPSFVLTSSSPSSSSSSPSSPLRVTSTPQHFPYTPQGTLVSGGSHFVSPITKLMMLQPNDTRNLLTGEEKEKEGERGEGEGEEGKGLVGGEEEELDGDWMMPSSGRPPAHTKSTSSQSLTKPSSPSSPSSSSSSSSPPPPPPPPTRVFHFKTRVPIKLLTHPYIFPASKIPIDITHLIQKDNIVGEKRYRPVLIVDEVWQLREEWAALNESCVRRGKRERAGSGGGGGGGEGTTSASVSTSSSSSSSDTALATISSDSSSSSSTPHLLPLTITLSPISLGTLRLTTQMAHSFSLLSQLGADDDFETETDNIKRLVLDTNIYLLALTLFVSLFHCLFDFLSFHADITFWHSKKTYTGISINSMCMNLLIRTIIMLYLYDQENTSRLVMVSTVMSWGIEVWKVTKLLRIEWTPIGGGAIWTRWIRVPYFGLSSSLSAAEVLTSEFDRQSLKYMIFVMVPTVLFYAIYGLLYYTYKSWYSWLLSSFAASMYILGMAMMLPQLFLNYKLKSVSHLPICVFIYRAFNTFIDDVFAFIIPMPTMHRLSVFRDDIVFLIYLYQRWIYRVDAARNFHEEEEGRDTASQGDGTKAAEQEGEGAVTTATATAAIDSNQEEQKSENELKPELEMDDQNQMAPDGLRQRQRFHPQASSATTATVTATTDG